MNLVVYLPVSRCVSDVVPDVLVGPSTYAVEHESIRQLATRKVRPSFNPICDPAIYISTPSVASRSVPGCDSSRYARAEAMAIQPDRRRCRSGPLMVISVFFSCVDAAVDTNTFSPLDVGRGGRHGAVVPLPGCVPAIGALETGVNPGYSFWEVSCSLPQ